MVVLGGLSEGLASIGKFGTSFAQVWVKFVNTLGQVWDKFGKLLDPFFTFYSFAKGCDSFEMVMKYWKVLKGFEKFLKNLWIV